MSAMTYPKELVNERQAALMTNTSSYAIRQNMTLTTRSLRMKLMTTVPVYPGDNARVLGVAFMINTKDACHGTQLVMLMMTMKVKKTTMTTKTLMTTVPVYPGDNARVLGVAFMIDTKDAWHTRHLMLTMTMKVKKTRMKMEIIAQISPKEHAKELQVANMIDMKAAFDLNLTLMTIMTTTAQLLQN